MPPTAPHHYLVIAHLSNADLNLYEEYEHQVLGLLPRYGGTLTRRVRSLDETVEVHLLSFENPTDFERFKLDDHRALCASLLQRSRVRIEAHEVTELFCPDQLR